MDEKRAKPCPFCGGGTVIFRNGTRETVKCIVCGAEVSRDCWAINDGAVDAWNRRTAGGHGARWIRTETGTTCEACGGSALLDDDGQTVLSTFCPHCGAKMWGRK